MLVLNIIGIILNYSFLPIGFILMDNISLVFGFVSFISDIINIKKSIRKEFIMNYSNVISVTLTITAILNMAIC